MISWGLMKMLLWGFRFYDGVSKKKEEKSSNDENKQKNDELNNDKCDILGSC